MDDHSEGQRHVREDQEGQRDEQGGRPSASGDATEGPHAREVVEEPQVDLRLALLLVLIVVVVLPGVLQLVEGGRRLEVGRRARVGGGPARPSRARPLLDSHLRAPRTIALRVPPPLPVPAGPIGRIAEQRLHLAADLELGRLADR